MDCCSDTNCSHATVLAIAFSLTNLTYVKWLYKLSEIDGISKNPANVAKLRQKFNVRTKHTIVALGSSICLGSIEAEKVMCSL